MATTVRSRRRPVRAVQQVRRNTPSGLSGNLLRVATSPSARAAFAVIGTIGLTAIAVALVGPKRIEREVLKPLRGAIEPQAEKLWADSKPLREQIAGLFKSATPSGRERLVRSFQSWIGHFHAT
ncbi:MAG TPA: hypothetical protein VIG39_10700 [Rhizomicrobium sp.]|jgi:hypothetical protein